MRSLIELLASLFGLITGNRPTARRYYGRKPFRKDAKFDSQFNRYVPSPEVLNNLSTAGVDLRSQDGPIFDQGQLGSCVAHGWLGMFLFVAKKLFGDIFL